MRYTLSMWLAILAITALVLASCRRDSESTAGEVDATSPVEETVTALATPTSAPASEQERAPTPTLREVENAIITESGLQYAEVAPGDGDMPEAGDIVFVHYTGTLEDGTVFDSSRNSGEPLRFALGSGQVIPGWDEGIALMNKGGQAILVIPPELGYGDRGAGNVIPPNATLVFDVELVDVQPGAPAAPTEMDESEYVATDTGLKYVDLVEGGGPSPKPGELVVVHYTGWLQDGGKFDSSLDRGEPFSFNVGMGQVIAGWDLGLTTMKVGGKRQLVIPPELGYGEDGAGNVIPPNAALVFEVELLEVR